MADEVPTAGLVLPVVLGGFTAADGGYTPVEGFLLAGGDWVPPAAGEGPWAILSLTGTVWKAFGHRHRDVTAEKRPLPGQLQTPISSNSSRISRSQRLLSLLQPVGISLSRSASIASHAVPVSGNDTCDSFSAQRLLCWCLSIMN